MQKHASCPAMSTDPYSDIIDLPHHVSTVHPQMPMRGRAAQFSPFAALVGYEDVIDETARRTTPERKLSEDGKAELDRRMGVVAAHLGDKPVVTVEYFVPDSRKDGGEYRFKTGAAEKILPGRRVVVVDGESIRMDRIVGLTGDLFEGEF